MSLALLAYIISVLGEAEIIASIIIWFTLVVVFISFMYTFMFPEDADLKKFQPYIKNYAKFIFIPTLILVTILPNKDEMYIMAGLIVGEQLLTSEKGNELLDKSYEALLVRIEESTKPDDK